MTNFSTLLYSRDPIGFAGGNNLWGYAGASPILVTDAVGLYEVIVTKRNDEPFKLASDDVYRFVNMSNTIQIWGEDIVDKWDLFSTITRFQGYDGINRLFFIGHGSPEVFHFDWIPSPVPMGHANPTVPAKNFTSEDLNPPPWLPWCQVSIPRPAMTFFFSCDSGKYPEAPGIGASWAKRTGSRTYARVNGLAGLTPWGKPFEVYYSMPIQVLGFTYGSWDWKRSYRDIIDFFMRSQQVVQFGGEASIRPY